MNTISNATSSLFLNEKIAKLKGTQTAAPQNQEFTQTPTHNGSNTKLSCPMGTTTNKNKQDHFHHLRTDMCFIQGNWG